MSGSYTNKLSDVKVMLFEGLSRPNLLEGKGCTYCLDEQAPSCFFKAENIKNLCDKLQTGLFV